MKKKIFGSIAVLAIAVMAAWNVNLNSPKNDLPDISLANVEAQAGELSEWWNSKTYRCEQDACSISAFIWTWYGKHEKCKDGNACAHCWNCDSCDA